MNRQQALKQCSPGYFIVREGTEYYVTDTLNKGVTRIGHYLEAKKNLKGFRESLKELREFEMKLHVKNK